MSPTTQEPFKLTSAIRHGTSWADQEHSPGWSAKSPPKFAEEMPEVVLDEQEYDRLPRSASTTGPIAVFVGGLDYSLEASELEEFFVSKNCKVSRVRILKSAGKSSGKALMNVPDEAALTAVIRLSGSQLSGRTLVIKEDNGPKPSNRRSEKKTEERWRDDSKPKAKKEGGWQSVSRGGKIVDAPRFKKTEKIAEEQPSDEIPKERKKLELKPRSKPLSELPEVSESARSSAIFGEAKPRDERAFTKEEPVKEAKPVKRKEKVKPTPKEEAVKEPAPEVVEPVKPPKTKRSSNRFAVDDSSSSSDEE